MVDRLAERRRAQRTVDRRAQRTMDRLAERRRTRRAISERWP